MWLPLSLVVPLVIPAALASPLQQHLALARTAAGEDGVDGRFVADDGLALKNAPSSRQSPESQGDFPISLNHRDFNVGSLPGTHDRQGGCTALIYMMDTSIKRFHFQDST
jgi:hypothetical protein